MILLDTNAILWALLGHPRVAPLLELNTRLYISPVSLLELKYLVEVGRLKEAGGESVSSVIADPRWSLDNPPSDRLFAAALDLSWTRDPFDRLLVAHAQHRRWRLATGDRLISTHLPTSALVAL